MGTIFEIPSNCRRRAVVWNMANELAGVAASLIGCKSVRLYQDCAFLKVINVCF